MQSIWKGPPQRRITVFGLARGFCNGWSALHVGQTYLVFANHDPYSGWHLDACVTARESSSLSYIQQLGKPTIVQRLPGRRTRPR